MPNSNDFNHFDYNPTDINIDRSLFNLDHSVKWSCDVGSVIPFEVLECVPGDTFSIDTSRVVRLQPLVAPIMDEVIQDTYWFFCPNRLVWNHWKEFCGENNSSPWAPQTTYTVPHLFPPEGGWNVGTIADYMGIPPKCEDMQVNALPFRAYALICDQWFRSESVMNPVNVSIDDTNRDGSNGDDQTIDIQLGGEPFIACKFFDRFTSALPSPQRGEPALIFPSGSFAPVVSLTEDGMNNYNVTHPYKVGNGWTGLSRYAANPSFSTHDGNSNLAQRKFTGLTGVRNVFTDDTGLKANISGFTPDITVPVYFNNLFASLDNSLLNINDLRSAFAVQRYLEKSARYGGRYIEFVKGFFGVDSPDARLQRTEYLGGSRLSLNINQVTQNSATESNTTPLGNVAGMSVTGDISSDVNYSCTEHGYIIGVSVLRYHHSYQQGLQKLWIRKNFEDFYLPTFAFLGEEPIYQEEIYNNDVDHPYEDGHNYTPRSVVFGYQERWSSYRALPNRVAGEMRTVSDTSLDVWHLGDYYTSPPTLTPEWLREDKSMLDRSLAVTSDVANQCICDFYIKIKAARPMPLYSIPGLIDHY